MWSKILALGVGGFIGSNLRYWISSWVLERFGGYFPYGTLMVNAIGCFIIGFITIYGNEVVEISPLFKIFITTGLLGALTTFSTFAIESFEFIGKANYLFALLNIGLNICVGLLAVGLGLLTAKAIVVTGYKVA